MKIYWIFFRDKVFKTDLEVEDSPAPGTSKPQSSWDEAQHVVRWSRSSQKRDSYVAAINSSQLTLEKLTDGGKPLTMEEVLLLESRNHGTSNQQDCGGLVLLNKVLKAVKNSSFSKFKWLRGLFGVCCRS